MTRRRKDPNRRYVNRRRWVHGERARAEAGLEEAWPPRRERGRLRSLSATGLLSAQEESGEMLGALSAHWPDTWGAMAPRPARGRATRELAELLALPDHEARLRAIEAEENPKRLSSPELARRLLLEARKALPGDPAASEAWARLALAVASRGDTSDHRARQAHAWGYLANGARVAERFSDAVDKLSRSHAALRETTVGDPAVLFEVNNFESNLARDRGEVETTLPVVQKGLLTTTLLENGSLLLRSLNSLGIVLKHLRKWPEALDCYRLALRHESADAPFELTAITLINIASCECAAGNYSEARRVLATVPAIFSGLVALRMTWLHGTIARGLGERQSAENAFTQCLYRFIEQRHPLESALVGLDLAGSFLETGQIEELRNLRLRIHKLLRVMEAERHPEAGTALRGFHATLSAMVRLTRAVATESSPPQPLLQVPRFLFVIPGRKHIWAEELVQ